MEESESKLIKREKSRRKIVKRDPELLKVQDALEHVLVAGAKVRRDDWRRQEFERLCQNENDANADANANANADANADADADADKKKRRRKRPRPDVHAEDFRIYSEKWRSENGQQQQQQEHGENKIRRSDSEWNVEYGDSVPPILFRMARLSQEYPTEEQIRMFNDPTSSRMKSLQSTDVTLDESEVPRALIERCWERAVHAASNGMIAKVMPAAGTSASRDPGSHNTHSLFDVNTPLSQESRRRKCESLGVDIDSLRQMSSSTAAGVSSQTACPRCNRSFQMPDELLQHYYGNTETRGCCEALIRPKYLELIRKILQRHVQLQTDQLLNIILTQAEVENSKNNEEIQTKQRKKKQKIDWKDVRRFLTNTVDDSTLIPDGRPKTRHPIQQSMRVGNASADAEVANPQAPLVLNPMILEVVNRRLIDRYANVPR